ncbi:SusC/RagA family TonB-linked outer membrane protein [Segetibacter aerophilus]|uniref:SusC/RagA family TonB-linked outer membrane protein n=1 Tax=Segetibacter aerophilus TaxID=670293 RepID=A0A512B901_9BACT|nr:SusC/RagA family TonB-linked outer membrane protein [Segetibacter aerophilus]GEO08409.1 SusC/RagA family TonB-linked outer membrane protein [Segetibacter aerophilus]
MKEIKLLLCLVILVCVSVFSFGQSRTVTGQVTDSKDNSPLVDATVSVVGKSVSTKTKADGSFSINVPSGSNQLRITYIGFQDQTVSITGSNVTISMAASTENLTDVVVVGYGTARRKDLTGSVASVKEKDFNKGVFTSPDQLIQGKAAGVLVINNTGQPGGSTTVRIRGASSIRSGNQPLFVVDGVPLSGGSARPGGAGSGSYGNDAGNPLNFINPSDIAGIEILKDASATAIYGSRGANGVVLITTKRGKSGAPQVDASASTSVSSLIKTLKVLNGDEYRAALKDYGLTSGDFGGNVNAFDAITRKGITQNYSTAIGGGTENGRYRISAGYLNQQGIIKTSNLKKFTANLTSNFRFLESKKLGLDINILVSQTDEQIAPISAFVGFEGNLISQALQWNPTHPLIKPGTDSAWIDPLAGETTINPLAQLRYFDDRAKVNSIIASISPSYKITKDLEYKFLYSVNRQVGVRRGQVNRLLNASGIVNRGAAFISNSEQTNTQITNTLNYNKQLTSDFNLNAVVGHEWLTFDSRGNSLNGQDFTNVGLNYYDYIGYSAQNTRGIGSSASPTTELQSYFGRAIINYKDRYLITGTFRADGSTRFGENNKYGYFPSVGVAWNASSENFLKNNTFINNLKVRASWGKTGNQEFPSGASLNRFGFGQQSISRAAFGNPDLKWETSTTTNAGIDFSILGNRIFGSVDYFYKKTTDVLFEQTIAQPAPSGRIWINLPGYVLNKGVEISLTGSVLQSKDLNWNIGGNASFLQNDVQGLKGFYETGVLRGQGFSDVRGQRLINGQPLNVWYLRRFEGIDKTTGQSIYTDGGNTLFYSGSPNPKMLLGLTTDFNYKKLTATVNMNGTFGHYLFNNTAASVLGIGNLGTRNIAKNLVGTGIKEAVSNAPSPSTRNLEKGNYIKMANATISYRIGNIGNSIRNLNISLTGQNLFVITKYSGFDPEVNTDAGLDGIPSLGVEYIPYPSARTFLLGLNFSL